MATNGVVSNPGSRFRKLKKRQDTCGGWPGRRPTVRGVAMSPVDHPHGGGEGKASGGPPSVTPWAKPTKGPPAINSRSKASKRKSKSRSGWKTPFIDKGFYEEIISQT